MKEIKDNAATPQQSVPQQAAKKAEGQKTYRSLLTLLVAGIAILTVLLVQALPSTYTKLDITSQHLLEITEQTHALIDGLSEDITIYHIVTTGKDDVLVSEMLKRYAAYGSRVKVVRVDPMVSPNFAAQYTDETVLDNSLVVVCGSRYKYVGYSDIFQADYSDVMTTGEYDTYFNGESAISGAIDYVTSTVFPVAYYLTGHGEVEMRDKLVNDITNSNIEYKKLDLLRETTIPEDASCLVIISPQADLNPDEKTAILDYLKAGGHMLLFTDYTKTPMPNLKEITDYYCVDAVEGIVVDANPSYSMGSYYQYLLPQMTTHDITNPLIRYNYRVMVPIAHGLTVRQDRRETLDIVTLLRTSDASFSKLAGYDMTTYAQEEGDIDGPFGLGVAVGERVSESAQTLLVWYSTANLLNEEANGNVSGANYNLVLNSLNWLCEREGAISISAKSLDEDMLTISTQQTVLWTVVFVGVIPAVFIIVGVIVYVRRKRKA